VNYSALTLHYFEAAVDAGTLAGPDVYRGAAGSRAQGTWVQFDVQVDSGNIRSARFLVFGCPHTIAVSAWVAEHAAGRAPRSALVPCVRTIGVLCIEQRPCFWP
jgi:NifU-like protein involved in Fe-S cluster formation